MTNKAICNHSIHNDFPSLGKIEATAINQSRVKRKEKPKNSQPEGEEDNEARRIRAQKHTEDFKESSGVQDLVWISP